MSNVVDFLERTGQDARLRHASAQDLEQRLLQEQMDPAVRAAIMAGDPQRLRDLLGAQSSVCCLIHAPEDDEDEPSDDEPSDDDDDQEIELHDRAIAAG